MEITRRELIALAGGAAALAVIGTPAHAAQAEVDALIKEFAGGEPSEGGVVITAPEIAENGNTVPVDVSAPGAASIMILATENPRPGVATFHFSALSADQSAKTRIRLAKTQDLIAVAKMQDGTAVMARRTVKVTIGGCGG